MRIVAQYNCQCGEGPLYDPTRNVVFWTDIDTGRLFQIDCTSHVHKQIYQGDPVGGFTLQEDGELLLFRVRDISLLNPETGELRKVRDFHDEGSTRFNDVSATPNGDVLAGTMGKTGTSGGLFLLRKDLSLTLLHRGTGCSNGMAFTPDLRTLYWTNTTTATIFAYDFDPETTAISNQRKFLSADPDSEGHPDGLAIDREGNLYSARWGGHSVYKLRPDGSLIERYEFPCANVTSLCFGGPKLLEMFVTTASRGDSDPKAGGLYLMRSEIAGNEEFRSRIKAAG